MSELIVVAGVSGNLGHSIAEALLKKRAKIRGLVRKQNQSATISKLKAAGAEILEVDYQNQRDLVQVCKGSSCVVSALSGLRPVIVDLQKALVDAAVEAKVKRFIPSDFAMDYTKIPEGENRNLSLRREFMRYLDGRPIQATSVLNGAYMDMLTGQAPFILFKKKRVLCWGNPDQLLDFTTIENTAQYTAEVALDSQTPRFLKIAGDQITANDLARIMSEITGEHFKLLRPGGVGLLSLLIKLTRAFTPDKGELYPVWQGMQYFHGMFSGQGKLAPLDNDRYPTMRWTRVRESLKHLGSH